MKKVKYRRRVRRYLIYLLFTATLFIAYDICFGYTLKGLVEQRLNQLFSDNMTFNIEHIEGGVFRDIVSNGITISHPELKEPFKLDRVEVPFRIWYPLVKEYGHIINLKTEGLRLFFGKDNPLINGYFSFEGAKSDLTMLGVFSLLGRKENITLRGKAAWIRDSLYNVDLRLNKDVEVRGLIDFHDESLKLDIITGKGKVTLNVISGDNNKVTVYARLEHINLNGTDIIGNINVTAEQAGNATRFNTVMKDLIINYSPFDKIVEIEGELSGNKDIVNISSIIVRDETASGNEGENIVKGYAVGSFLGEKYINSGFVINKINIEDFIPAGFSGEMAVKGVLSGEIKMRGPLNSIKSDVHISLHNGKINDFEFRSLSATLKGIGSVLNIEEGRITKGDGNLIVSGGIDFSLLSRNKAFDKMKIETDQKLAVWEKWEISKQVDTSKIRAEKRLGRDDVTLSFETYANRELFKTQVSDKENEIGVEYKIDKNESLQMKLKDEESFLGVEHKVRF